MELVSEVLNRARREGRTPLASEMVREFHHAFGLPVAASPEVSVVPVELLQLRLDLINEEWMELREGADAALQQGRKPYRSELVQIADALGDLVYVINGMALALGIDLDAVVAEIHRSNMTKLGDDGRPVYREDGKVLKGEHYEAPNLEAVLWPEK